MMIKKRKGILDLSIYLVIFILLSQFTHLETLTPYIKHINVLYKYLKMKAIFLAWFIKYESKIYIDKIYWLVLLNLSLMHSK